jgi:hypothetical protein
MRQATFRAMGFHKKSWDNLYEIRDRSAAILGAKELA